MLRQRPAHPACCRCPCPGVRTIRTGARHCEGTSDTGAAFIPDTNAIENLNGLVGRFTRNVRRWRDGHMLVRWIAAALQEARRSFRRLRGHRDLAALIHALDRRTLDATKEVA
jgi:hypothetical protein